VIDLRSAQGASVAIDYVEEHHLPMCIVPGATVNTNDRTMYAVYGVVNHIIVPSGLPLANLIALVQEHQGFLGTFPVEPRVVEIEVAQLTIETVIEALSMVSNIGDHR
jgi:hypothetical protein